MPSPSSFAYFETIFAYFETRYRNSRPLPLCICTKKPPKLNKANYRYIATHARIVSVLWYYCANVCLFWLTRKIPCLSSRLLSEKNSKNTLVLKHPRTKKTILIPICIRRKGKCFSGFAQTTKMFFLVFPVCAASL